jgi:hypothetical protein
MKFGIGCGTAFTLDEILSNRILCSEEGNKDAGGGSGENKNAENESDKKKSEDLKNKKESEDKKSSDDNKKKEDLNPELETLRSENRRLLAEKEKADKEKKEAEDKELKDKGDWKALAERKEAENKELRDKVAKRSMRAEIVQELLEEFDDLDVAREVSLLIPLKDVKLEDDGSVSGAKEAVEKYKNSRPGLFKRLSSKAGNDEDEGNAKDDKQNQNRNQNQNRPNKARSYIDTILGRGSDSSGNNNNQNPPKGGDQVISVRDMTREQYNKHIKDTLSGLRRSGQINKGTRRRMPA